MFPLCNVASWGHVGLVNIYFLPTVIDLSSEDEILEISSISDFKATGKPMFI